MNWDMGVEFAVIPPIILFFFNTYVNWFPFMFVGILFGELWVGPEPDACIELKKSKDE